MSWKGSTATVVGLPALAVVVVCRCFCQKKTAAPRITAAITTAAILATGRLRRGGVSAASTFPERCVAELMDPAVAESAIALAT